MRGGEALVDRPPDSSLGEIQFSVPEITDADVAAVVRVLRGGWLTTGPECQMLEEELAAYTGAAHVVATSSCTHALEIAVAALGLRPGARVGVPTWTFSATALSAYRTGAVPVLLDVEPGTLNLSPSALAAEIDVGLDAVIAVHFGGVPAGREIRDLCSAAGIPLIEDAAHALGASDDRGRVGAGKDSAATCFSFYASKNLTCGEGGALATSDADLAEFARRYRLHGLTRDALARHGRADPYDVTLPGLKANMPDVLAALARSQLARLDDMQARRRSIVEQYRRLLAGVAGVRCVPEAMDAGSADHLMVVALPDDVERSSIVQAMAAEGIQTSVHFQPLHHLEWFRQNVDVGIAGVEVAEGVAPTVLSLPLHPRLRARDVERVCDSFISATHRRR